MYALITGASRGIGKACALSFAQAGYNLILVCKSNIDNLIDYAKTLEGLGVTCYCYKCNVGDPNDVDALFCELDKKHVHIDVLINNAGISYVGLLQDMSFEDWNNTINTNLSSVFYMSRKCIPAMVSEQKGKIINIASVWGSMGASMEVAYSASKGGVISFTKALAKELAPSNIQVNSISFGAIDTEMNGHLSNEELEELANEIPASRLGKVSEAGKMILDVAKLGDYVTGSNITMDGAWC